MVLIEAMACGCPVVASNTAGVGELVVDRGTGRLYEAGDVGSAASAVLELLNPALDSERHKLVERAYRTVADRHSLNEAGRRYAAILSRPPRARPRPLVSAIMIFLNAEAFIEEAIESVLAQTYDAWELLLIDGGSTDASPDIARRYCARYPGKVRHLEHPGHVNRGKSAARNLGVQHARGTYLAFLDADDVWLPNKLEEQVEILETYPEAAMVYGRTLRWHSWTLLPADETHDSLTELGVPRNQLIQPPELVRASLNEDNIFAIRGVLIRRSVIDPGCRFADELEALEELAVYVPVFLRAPVFASSRCWGRYRQHPSLGGAAAPRTKRWDRVNPNQLRERYLRWLDRTFKQMGISNLEMRWLLALRLLPYRHPLVSHFVARAKHVAQRVVHGLTVFVLDRRRWVTNAIRGDLKATASPARLTELGIGVTTLSWRSTAAEVELRIGAPDGPLYCRRGPSGSVAVLQWPGERRLWYLQDASNDGTTTLRRTLGMVAMSTPKEPANSATSSGEYSVTTVHEDRPRTLLVASGQPLFVGNGAIRGHLEHVAAESGVLRLVGWAASVTENGGPCTVVVFIGDRLRCTAVTGVERPDLADGPLGSLLRTAGFECVMPGDAEDVSRVRAFAISNGEEAIELSHGVRRSTRRQYRLTRDPTGAESLSMDDGSEAPIAAGAAEGFLEAVILDHGRAVFTGWAAEPAHSGPAEDVVIFVDDRFAGAKPPHVERPDVVQAYGTEVLRFTGFLFNLPCRIPPDEEIRSVRAFAISHSGTASELRSLGRFQDRRATAAETGWFASARDPDRPTEQRRSTPRPFDRVRHKATPPLVTSILTTYNHASFIEQAVRSVQDQDLAGRHQIVVIDDCSTDGTTDILRRIWADDKERIQLIVAPQNECSNRRFAAALEASEGPFVAVLDGDDYWTDPLKLQRQIDFLQANEGCAISCHNALIVYDDGTPSRPYAYGGIKQVARLADILEHNFICGCTAVLRARACRSLPPWYVTAPYGDWPLWILAALHGDIGYTDEIMATYRVHRHGLWSGASRARQLEWDLMLYECLALNVGFERVIIDRRRRQRAYDLAVEHEKCGDIAQAAKYLRLCVANRPPGAVEAHLHGTDPRPWLHRVRRMLPVRVDGRLPKSG